MRYAMCLGADLTGAVLDQADMRGADFTGATLNSVSIRDCNLGQASGVVLGQAA